MDVKVVQELKPYSFKQIAEWFNQDEDSTKKIIDRLVLMNILKKPCMDTEKFDLKDLFEFEYFEDINNSVNRNIYQFKYVGMVMIRNSCFFIYPKYILEPETDKQNNYRKFKQILSVIRKYESKEQRQNVVGTEQIMKFNLLPFTLDLLQDYYENGVYSNDKTVIEENGCGEILWEKTINEKNVYFSNKTPVYLDLYTVNNVVNEEDVFRRLHRCIISSASENIKEVLEVLEIPPVIISSERIEDFGDKEYLIYKIKQEFTQQFITRKQDVLYKMLSYISKDEIYNSKDEISFVGTYSFNLIWEDVCACVMGNCLKKTLSELKLKPYGVKKGSDILQDIIPNPKWKHYDSNNIHEINKTLIPDIITVANGNLSIYDAKYYKIRLDEKGVWNQPGVGDVTKQYLYEIVYKALAKKNNLKIDKNAFLMPTDGNEEKCIGMASMDLFSIYGEKNRCNDIEVVLKPCEEMFEKYLNNRLW